MNVRNANPNIICTGECKFATVKQTLDTGSLNIYIPMFQRRYCWGAKVLRKFLKDVESVSSVDGNPAYKPVRPHSFGRILTSTREGRILLIDGQQRITTISILLASIRDALSSCKLSAGSQEVKSAQELKVAINNVLFHDVMQRPSSSALASPRKIRRPRLTPSLDDRKAFLMAISPSKTFDSDRLEGSENHISRAKAMLYTSLKGRMAERGKDTVKFLKGLFYGVLNNCKLLRFETKEEDLFCVFERLAFRAHALSFMHNAAPGMQLAEADLVKNFLLSFFSDERAKIAANRDLWIPMEREVVRATSKGGCQDVKAVGNRLDLLMMAYFKEKAGTSDLMSKPLAKEKENHGGAVHYFQKSFPTYVALRRYVEGMLQAEAADVTSVQAKQSLSLEARGIGPKQDKATRIIIAFMKELLSFAKLEKWKSSLARK